LRLISKFSDLLVAVFASSLEVGLRVLAASSIAWLLAEEQ